MDEKHYNWGVGGSWEATNPIKSDVGLGSPWKSWGSPNMNLNQPTQSLPSVSLPATEQEKLKHQRLMQKIKYRHIADSNQSLVDKHELELSKTKEQCALAVEKAKQESEERIALQTAKYSAIETVARCIATASTVISALYFLA